MEEDFEIRNRRMDKFDDLEKRVVCHIGGVRWIVAYRTRTRWWC